MKHRTIITIILAMAILMTSLIAIETKLKAEKSSEKSFGLGQKLVEKIWMLMKKGDTETLQMIMSKEFQSLHQDGSRNIEEELELISKLDLGEYKLTDFTTTRNKNTLVVTYFVSVEETIEDKRLDSEPSPRMSVFVQEGENWLWVAHANLKPMSK